MIYVKRSDFFRREGLYKIRAQFLRLCSDELMKLCLKNCVPPPQKKKNSSRKRKQTRNDLIMITPATPKSRRSSEKQNSFPSATNWAAPVIKILIRRQKAWCLCCGLWGQSYLPGLRQEWLKYNPPHCWTRSGVPAKPVFQNALAFVSEDAYGCKNIEKELFIEFDYIFPRPTTPIKPLRYFRAQRNGTVPCSLIAGAAHADCL